MLAISHFDVQKTVCFLVKLNFLNSVFENNEASEFLFLCFVAQKTSFKVSAQNNHLDRFFNISFFSE